MDKALCFPVLSPDERASVKELQEQRRILEGDEYLQRLFKTIPSILMILNRQRQLVSCNPALLKLLGKPSVDPLIGLRPGEFMHCVRAKNTTGGCGTTEGCRTCGAFQALFNTHAEQEHQQECRITVDAGDTYESIELKVDVSPLEISGIPFAFFHMRDISDEKRRKVLERIFFHDVLNTTSNLINIVDILDQEIEGDKNREFLDYLKIVSRRLLDEIRAQREILAAENHELRPDFVPIDSLTLIRGLVTQYSKHEVAEGKQIILGPDLAEVRFLSDPILLGRVLGNMLKNAIEASPQGATVTINCRVLDEHIEFRVHNEGVMPREVQLQIFQRSFSTKGSSRGIGTYSMRLLSERYLKGTIGFESSAERGTVFFARYPKDQGTT